jgi:hypothetical protein
MSTDDSRRRFLQTSGLGIGWLAVLDLLQQNAAAGDPSPLAPKKPPLRPTAKSVISLFMQGGPSQVDTSARQFRQRGFSERQAAATGNPRLEANLPAVR